MDLWAATVWTFRKNTIGTGSQVDGADVRRGGIGTGLGRDQEVQQRGWNAGKAEPPGVHPRVPEDTWDSSMPQRVVESPPSQEAQQRGAT